MSEVCFMGYWFEICRLILSYNLLEQLCIPFAFDMRPVAAAESLGYSKSRYLCDTPGTAIAIAIEGSSIFVNAVLVH